MRPLARLGRIRSRFGPQRELRITRDGWFYGAFTLGVGAAAVNTGNNLLYLVGGLLLASIVTSGVLSEAALHGLSLRSLGGRDAHAGDEALWLLQLSKRGGRIPSFALVLTALDGPAQGASAGVLRLAPGGDADLELRYTPPRRGRFITRRLRASTRFPFGLFEKSRELEVEQELFVYPRRTAVAPPPLAPARETGERRTQRPGRGAEPLTLRPLAPGDGLGQLHWRKSAQLGSWVVTVREREEERAVALEVSLRAQPDPDDLARLEGLLERAAASVTSALGSGLAVSLVAGPARIPGATGPAQRRRLLRALATAEPELEPEGSP